MNQINLITWFSTRECEFLPKHFIPTQTPIDDDKLCWVLEKLKGRYYIGNNPFKPNTNFFLELHTTYIFFEDPQEAVLYELTWS